MKTLTPPQFIALQHHLFIFPAHLSFVKILERILYNDDEYNDIVVRGHSKHLENHALCELIEELAIQVKSAIDFELMRVKS